MSLLTSGWFPPGWIVGNVLIGLWVGHYGVKSNASTIKRVLIIVSATFLGVFVAKTLIECFLYSIPLVVKAPKSLVVWVMDAAVMSIGTWIAPKIPVKYQV